VKFLIDNQLPKALAEHLRARGQDCQHVLEAGLAHASDISICRYAEAQDRILISKDEDFLYLCNLPTSKIRLVWVRLGNCRTTVLLAAFDRLWSTIESCFATGDRIVEIR
jgi:predicted nuclease of predicted toxin-antitoxin system